MNKLRKRDEETELHLSITSLDVVDPPREEDRKNLGQRLVDLASKMKISAAHKELEEMLAAAMAIANGEDI